MILWLSYVQAVCLRVQEWRPLPLGIPVESKTSKIQQLISAIRLVHELKSVKFFHIFGLVESVR